MTILIPADLETMIRAAVQAGRFASVDEAMTRAARLLVDELQTPPVDAASSNSVEETPDLVLGSMRDHADLMDEIVSDIYRSRQAQAEAEQAIWRV